jgi:hypothetical protein
VPTGWVGHETIYTDVVRTSCRTCHVNRDPTIDWNKFSGGLPFTGFKEYGPITEPYLCEFRIMPHSKVTYIGFWSNSTSVSNPNRISEIRNAGLDDFTPSDACPVH